MHTVKAETIKTQIPEKQKPTIRVMSKSSAKILRYKDSGC